MTYKASYDNTVKFVTISFTALLTFLVFFELTTLSNIESIFVPVLILCVLLSVLVVSFLISVSSYTIETDNITINKRIGNIVINKSDIQSIKLLSKDDLKWTIRTFGVGGLFGYYGKFSNRKIGSMTWYVTHRNKTILITTTAGKKILISPDEPETFITECNI